MRDIDIRRALRSEMKRLHGHDPNTRIVEELGLCQGIARVDVAVVNGTLHGYEIKSEHDTLVRLPVQSSIYNQALELVTIVTAPAHVKQIRRMVPRWWGIWSASQDKGEVRLRCSRQARLNPEVSLFAMAQLLWREEALAALEDRGLAEGLRSRPRGDLWRALAVHLSHEELGELVRDRLKRRVGAWRVPKPQA